MSGRIFLNGYSRVSAFRTSYGFKLWEGFSHHSYSTAQKVEKTINENMNNPLLFKDFKKKYVESWETFKESPMAKIVYGNDLGKISKAYERFCLLQYSQYKRQLYGRNSLLMT